MRSALTELTQILESSGMNRKETDHLLARFLQEEAFDYVEYIEEELKKTEFVKRELKDFS